MVVRAGNGCGEPVLGEGRRMLERRQAAAGVGASKVE